MVLYWNQEQENLSFHSVDIVPYTAWQQWGRGLIYYSSQSIQSGLIIS